MISHFQNFIGVVKIIRISKFATNKSFLLQTMLVEMCQLALDSLTEKSSKYLLYEPKKENKRTKEKGKPNRNQLIFLNEAKISKRKEKKKSNANNNVL